jgi:hypothetical protein
VSRYVDPVLIATSDCLVITALERAWSRVVPRSARGSFTGPRWRGYERVPIRPDRIDKALEGAWDLCSTVAGRSRLPVDYGEWAALLDAYTRALIMSCQPHDMPRLADFLAELGGDRQLARPFVAAG